MGIDNAGKTSIITTMKKRFDVPNEIKGLKPTKQIERSSVQFLDHIIYQSDYGGQEIYRNEYLEHKDRYLAGIDLLFYVIDIQDSMRFQESVKYLTSILNYFEEIDDRAPIMIFFHKVDPRLRGDPTIINNVERIKTELQPFITDHKVQFTQTTIFELHTVIDGFSRGISMLYTKHEVIHKFVLDIVEKMENVLSLLIFEQNGIELGAYFMEHLPLKMRKKILTLYEIAQRRILAENRETYEFSDRLDAFTKVSGVIQSFDVEGLVFFIMLVLEEHSEEVVIDQFNFFEQSYTEIYEILRTILLDEPEKIKALNPNDQKLFE